MKLNPRDFHLFSRSAILAFASAASISLSPLAAPGDGEPVSGVHPAYAIETVTPSGFSAASGGTIDFLSDGRLVVSSAQGGNKYVRGSMSGSVYIMSGMADNGPRAAKSIIDGLKDPTGIKVLGDTIYVVHKHQLLELTDPTKSGTWTKRVVCEGYDNGNNWMQYDFGLAYKDGWFYIALSNDWFDGNGIMVPNTRQSEQRGNVIRIERATGKWERFAGGVRTPNGITFSPDGELFTTDNQGHYLPGSKLNHIRKDKFYGYRLNLNNNYQKEGAQDAPPAVWLPHQLASNSPSYPIFLKVGPYAGQVLSGSSLFAERIHRYFVEKIGDQYQGALFPFSLGFNGYTEGLAERPDGSIYVTLSGGEGPGWSAPNYSGIQRMKLTGTTPFEMLAIRSRNKGFEIEFTKPANAAAGQASSYAIKSWTYKPTADYGGLNQEAADNAVTAVKLSADGKKASLDVSGLKVGRIYEIRIPGVKSASNENPWAARAWYTLNNIAEGEPSTALQPQSRWAFKGLRFGRQGAGYMLATPAEHTQVEIISTDGRLAYRESLSGAGSHLLNYRVQTPGLYTIKVTSGAETAAFRSLLLP